VTETILALEDTAAFQQRS